MTDDKHKMIARQMGQRVRTGRVFKGLTGAELAAQTGLPRWQLKQIEAGFGLRVSADNLVAIARTLELPLWFFFEVPLDGEAPPVCPICKREWPA